MAMGVHHRRGIASRFVDSGIPASAHLPGNINCFVRTRAIHCYQPRFDFDSSDNNKYFVIITNKKNNTLVLLFPDIIKPLILSSRRKASSINKLY
jgi:hypothetical protein